MCIITDPVVTLDNVRDVVIRSYNNITKRNQVGKKTSKVYIVYVTKLLSMVNTRGLNCYFLFHRFFIQVLAADEFLSAL